jgi:hypothetical protein
VSVRERSITLVLVVSALVAWFCVVLVFLTLSPQGDAGVQLLGSISLGVAVALTAWPLLWAMRRGAPGSLVSAGRRAGLIGLVISILVVLRVLDAVSVPVVLFLLIGAVMVELALTLRR